MALQYPRWPNIPQYESSLAAFMPAFEKGQTDRKGFDAQQVLAGRTGEKPVSPLERLVGLVTGGKETPAQGPYTRPATAVAAIDQAAPQAPAAAMPTTALGGQPPAAPSIPTGGPAGIPQGYMANARAAESGGNDAARNPNSSATGRYQFLDGTWSGLMNQYPELGLTPEGRTDPDQQERAMGQFTRDNARALSGAGIPVNPGSLYAAHFLGSGGATKVLGQDPSSPMSAYVESGVIEANPHLANMTVGEFTDWTNRKGGNSSGGYSGPMPADQPRPGNARQFTPEEIGILMASEETRPFAMQLLNNNQQSGRFETIEQADGSVWQVDRMTGEQNVLQAAPQAQQRRIVQGPDGNSYYEDGSRVLPGVEAPAAAPDAPELKTIFDAATGREQTVQWNGSTWEPVGGVEAPANPLVEVNTGDLSGASGDFYKGMDADLGKQQALLIDAGRSAQSNNMRLGQLSTHLANSPQGAQGAMVQFAGNLGINVEGLDDVQAAQALISQMVPGQRPAGSGTMSDADLELFKQSLPRILNQPGGNARIIQTTKAVNDYTIAQALIAERVASREITPAEGRELQRQVPNPLKEFSGANGPDANDSAVAKPVTDADYQSLPSGALFIDPDDGQTYRKP